MDKDYYAVTGLAEEYCVLEEAMLRGKEFLNGPGHRSNYRGI